MVQRTASKIVKTAIRLTIKFKSRYPKTVSLHLIDRTTREQGQSPGTWFIELPWMNMKYLKILRKTLRKNFSPIQNGGNIRFLIAFVPRSKILDIVTPNLQINPLRKAITKFQTPALSRFKKVPGYRNLKHSVIASRLRLSKTRFYDMDFHIFCLATRSLIIT